MIASETWIGDLLWMVVGGIAALGTGALWLAWQFWKAYRDRT